jgi:hypothetical protein
MGYYSLMCNVFHHGDLHERTNEWMNKLLLQGTGQLNQEMLTQGFTHVPSLTFASSGDLTADMTRPRSWPHSRRWSLSTSLSLITKPPPQA